MVDSAEKLVRSFGLAGSLLTLGLTASPARSAPDGDVSRAPVAAVAPVVHQEPPGVEAYLRHCTICHGEEGRGDGPAARALDPAPPDFADAESVSAMSDAQVLEVIARGRRSMPGFEAVLAAEVRTELLAYLRELSDSADR